MLRQPSSKAPVRFLQPSLFEGDLAGRWSPPRDYPRLSSVELGFDYEVKDPLLKTHGPGWCWQDGGEVAGFSIFTDGWKGYFPLAHAGGGNVPREGALRWLADVLGDASNVVVSHNAPYERGWTRKLGIPWRARSVDTGVLAPLLDENRFSYKLDDLAKDYLGESKEFADFQEARRLLMLRKRDKAGAVMENLWQLPAYYVGPYAEQDAGLALRLYRRMMPEIEKQDLGGICKLEHNLQTVLIEMRARGVRVDLDRAEQLRKKYQAAEREAVAEIKRLSGVAVDVWANESVARMCDALGVGYPRTANNAPSFRQDWLKAHSHPAMQQVVKARKYNKARTTFVEGYVLGHARNGRCHVNYHALRSDSEEGAGGAVTGRFSSSNFNMQNLPARDAEIGPEVRSMFLPEDGEQWAAVDFSSQEPRLCVHFAHAAKVAGVQPFVDGYRADPNMDFHQKGADICGLPRKNAKNITLGKMYGMGGAKLCHSLGLPTEWIDVRDRNTGRTRRLEVAGPEGQAIMDRYDKFMPFVSALANMATKRAENRHWIRTLLGRLRRFQCAEHPRGAYPFKALNCLIQGSAADMTKKAMLDVYAAGAVPLATVHDELGFSCAEPKRMAELRQIMSAAVPLAVPVTCDVEYGPSWGEATLKLAA